MLTAADVDAPDFATGSPILANFLTCCVNFTCYYSADDGALSYSAKHHHKGTSRLGQVGFSKRTTDAEGQCVNVNCAKYYESHVRPQDQSALNSHKWYLTPAYFADFIADLDVITDASNIPNREPDSTKYKGWYDLVKARSKRVN
jgi:esterase/lipase superfamily enzyme